MKWITCFLLLSTSFLRAQNLQFDYDLRKTADPAHNPKNFPTLYFEYWKGTDSGSILVKTQADLSEGKGNIGKSYLQVAGGFRVYRKTQLHLSYSGGLGLTNPREYSYVLTNTFQAGLAQPFTWKGAYCTAILDGKYVPFKKPSFDPIFTFYWWKGLMNYRMEFLGDFSLWTENKNHGNESTPFARGKRFSFYAEPQLWVKLYRSLFAGTRINCYYHVLLNDNSVQVYPSLGLRVKL